MKRSDSGAYRRRGVVAVKVALLSVVLIGFVALGVDIGVIYNARHELRRATIASALAGAAMLAQTGGEGLDPALNAAVECAEGNRVANDGLTLDVLQDVLFGRWDEELREFAVDPADVNAVRVIGRRTESSPDGEIGLFFASIFGVTSTGITASATAVMKPRDIAMVVDLSNSHNNDSELGNVHLTSINAWDVWVEMFDRGDWPGWSADDPQAAGWGWGFFKQPGRGWGYDTANESSPTTELDPDTYDPSADRGFVHLEFTIAPTIQKHWDPSKKSDYAALQGYLGSRSYEGDFSTSGSEVSAILGDHLYNTFPRRARRLRNWRNRAAVATGMAEWNSGIAGGRWEDLGLPPGNGDDIIDDGELIWDNAGLGGRSAEEVAEIWDGYARSYALRSNTRMVNGDEGGDADFQWKFGIKTFMNYFLERRPSFNETPEFVPTPAQPMLAVKQAVEALAQAMATELNDLLSLEVFGTTVRHEVDLTSDILEVPDRLYEMQAGYYDGYTNMGGGLRLARETLESPPSRSNATKVIVLLTDGRPTAWETLSPMLPDGEVEGDPTTALPSQPARLEQARQYAIQQAEWARDAGIRIIAVSVGADADLELMELFAGITDGKHYHAEGNIDEYSAQLRAIFEEIAVIRPVTLVQ